MRSSGFFFLLPPVSNTRGLTNGALVRSRAPPLIPSPDPSPPPRFAPSSTSLPVLLCPPSPQQSQHRLHTHTHAPSCPPSSTPTASCCDRATSEGAGHAANLAWPATVAARIRSLLLLSTQPPPPKHTLSLLIPLAEHGSLRKVLVVQGTGAAGRCSRSRGPTSLVVLLDGQGSL